MSEVAYKDIPGFPGYRIGSDGSVWSKRSRKMSGRLNSDWHRLTLTTRKSGYITACFPRRLEEPCPLHPPPCFGVVCRTGPDGMECCHGPGGPQTIGWRIFAGEPRKKTTRTSSFTAASCVADRHPNTKISDREVDVIRFLTDEGVPRILLAAAFGVSRARIGDIASGRSRIAP